MLFIVSNFMLSGLSRKLWANLLFWQKMTCTYVPVMQSLFLQFLFTDNVLISEGVSTLMKAVNRMNEVHGEDWIALRTGIGGQGLVYHIR
jgi:hypothetical protein